MSREQALLDALAQRFPGLGGAAGAAHVEALGLFTASAWRAPELQQAGVPAQTLHSLAGLASQVASARRGGTQLLCEMRAAMGDSGFLHLVGVLAPLYGRARQSGRQVAVAATAQTAIQPSPQPARPEVAGFEVHEELGAGNMGRVYKARQKSLDRMVALKVLFRTLAEEDETYVARFEREARASAKLQHPNIVMVIDAGICPKTGVQFIAMELVDGQSLGQILAERGKLSLQESLTIALALTQALDCAERNGIVHRDLKPDNVLVGSDGIPRLVDLGLAKKREAKDLTGAGIVVGTPIYMAPEQAMAIEEVDGRADLYSLGITLFQLVTGEVPLQAETAMGVLTRHINEDIPDPRALDPSLPPAFSALIAGLCARDVNERYPGALAAAGDLERVLSGQSPLGPSAAQRAAETTRSTGSFRVGSVSGSISGVSGPIRPELQAPEELGAAAAALWRFERSGFPGFLVEASDAGGEDEASRLALARAALWRGDAAAARSLGDAVFEANPESEEALALLSLVERGEAAFAGFRGALLQLASLAGQNRHADARSLAGELQRSHPSEPHPHLILAVLGSRTRDETAIVQSLQLAWALFPSRGHAPVTLGAGLDLEAAAAFVDRGRAALEGDDPQQRALTATGTDDKSNLVAGALRMGIGVAHAYLAELTDRDPAELREALRTIARGLTGLQHFGHAGELLARLEKLGTSAEDAAWIEAERRLIGGYRSVDQPGIQPRRGRYACPVAADCVNLIRTRLQGIATQIARAESQLEAGAARLAQLVQEDAAARAEVEAAARELGREPPLAELEAATQELEAVAAEMSAHDNEAPTEAPKSTGFFSKLKTAANTAGRAAKAGHLKLRHSQAVSKRAKAEKALGEELARELVRGTFQHAVLRPTAHEHRKLLTTLAAVRREDTALRRRLDWLGA